MYATLRELFGLFGIAHERSHIVRTSKQGVEDCGTDVAHRARQEDSHRARIVVVTCLALFGPAET